MILLAGRSKTEGSICLINLWQMEVFKFPYKIKKVSLSDLLSSDNIAFSFCITLNDNLLLFFRLILIDLDKSISNKVPLLDLPFDLQDN